MSNVRHEAVEAKIDQIEAEMKRVGIWQAEPLPPEMLQIHSAFGQGQMTFEQWLQFILIPRVREILASRGPWPRGSQVAVQAMREWEMWGVRPDCEQLLRLLREFDDLF